MNSAAAIVMNQDEGMDSFVKLVNKGVRLCRAIKKATEELDLIKKQFRTNALEQIRAGLTESPVEYIGTQGSATVVVKGDSLKVKKDQEERAVELKEKLPPEIFHRLFDVKTVLAPVKDFKERFGRLPEDQKALILQYFAWNPNSPAVEFSK